MMYKWQRVDALIADGLEAVISEHILVEVADVFHSFGWVVPVFDVASNNRRCKYLLHPSGVLALCSCRQRSICFSNHYGALRCSNIRQSTGRGGGWFPELLAPCSVRPVR